MKPILLLNDSKLLPLGKVVKLHRLLLTNINNRLQKEWKWEYEIRYHIVSTEHPNELLGLIKWIWKFSTVVVKRSVYILCLFLNKIKKQLETIIKHLQFK